MNGDQATLKWQHTISYSHMSPCFEFSWFRGNHLAGQALKGDKRSAADSNCCFNQRASIHGCDASAHSHQQSWHVSNISAQYAACMHEGLVAYLGA
jgi:hypothetical protein